MGVKTLETRAEGTSIYDSLAPRETVICTFGPFCATSFRLLRLDSKDGPSRGQILEIAYPDLTAVKIVHKPNHPMLIMGTVSVVLGLLLTPILVFSPIFSIIVGGLFLFIGAKGKAGYFQIYARDMPKHAEQYWQVAYERSATFIATVRSIIGEMPDF